MLRNFARTLGILVATSLTTIFLLHRTSLIKDKIMYVKDSFTDSAGEHTKTLSEQEPGDSLVGRHINNEQTGISEESITSYTIPTKSPDAQDPVSISKKNTQEDRLSKTQDDFQQKQNRILSDIFAETSAQRSGFTASTFKSDLFLQNQTSNTVSSKKTTDIEQHIKSTSFSESTSFQDLSQEKKSTSDSSLEKKSEKIYHYKNDSLPILPDEDVPHSDTCSRTGMKYIGFYDLTLWLMDYPGQEMFQDCEYSCCSINTTAAFKNNVEHLDAIMFNPYLLRDQTPPTRLNQNQIWIFLSIEPPPYTSRSAWTRDDWKGLFNWTMTYRHDSDIVLPYITVEKDAEPHRKDYDSVLAQKTKKAMWVVSHCQAVSRRDEYIRMLNKTYTVDIFGKCGTLRCQDCEGMYERYKFLVAFENSFCLDYISEKLSNGLTHDIVPVVRGAGNHSQLFPPGTYIDAEEFNSVEELGDHLNYLESNDTAYLQYLKNKEGYTFHRFSMKTKKASYCELCKKLHNLDKYGGMIPDLATWLDKCDLDIAITEYKRVKADDDHDDVQN